MKRIISLITAMAMLLTGTLTALAYESESDMENAESGVLELFDAAYAAKDGSGLVVTLDPGHGGQDDSTPVIWDGKEVWEKVLNLKIANACKQELEKYDGVTVYMTRTGDTLLSLEERVKIAAAYKSDVLVSMHNNWNADPDNNGALVIISNGAYRPALRDESRKLGAAVLKQLQQLGIALGIYETGTNPDGFLIKNSSSKVYPNGATADYYGITRNATQAGMASVIIEHATASNREDYDKHLSTDEQLAELGRADARAIAEAYGLTAKQPSAADNGDAPFTDVFSGAYYYDAAIWAAQNKIAFGVDETHFAPDKNCSRAEIVTFLWRAENCPKAEGFHNPFTDVKETDWYYEAVQWAAANGITSGTSDTTFSPERICSRAETVTFLWNHAGKPEIKASNPFADVPKGWYEQPVLWAAANEITKGTSETTFSPQKTCTRAEIVTFIHRYAQMK